MYMKIPNKTLFTLSSYNVYFVIQWGKPRHGECMLMKHKLKINENG